MPIPISVQLTPPFDVSRNAIQQYCVLSISHSVVSEEEDIALQKFAEYQWQYAGAYSHVDIEERMAPLFLAEQVDSAFANLKTKDDSITENDINCIFIEEVLDRDGNPPAKGWLANNLLVIATKYSKAEILIHIADSSYVGHRLYFRREVIEAHNLLKERDPEWRLKECYIDEEKTSALARMAEFYATKVLYSSSDVEGSKSDTQSAVALPEPRVLVRSAVFSEDSLPAGMPMQEAPIITLTENCCLPWRVFKRSVTDLEGLHPH